MKILNFIILIGVIAVNALANILPINGVTTGEVSAQYDNYFTPAGFTFSIWSVIYLSLLVFAFYQFISKTYDPKRIGYFFVVNGLANMSWILAWHYGYYLPTVLIMLLLLGTLIAINTRIERLSWFVKFPFRIYLGWICVAAIANLAVYLKYLDWQAFGIAEQTWGIMLVVIAGSMGLLIIYKKHWVFTSLVIAWGTWGIYNKQIQMNRAEPYQIVCLVVIVLLVVTTLTWLGYKRKLQANPT